MTTPDDFDENENENENANADRLRRYLLHQLPEAESQEIELALLSDDELYDLMLAVEEELIDECARGDLVTAEAESLLGYLSRLEDGPVRLELSKALASSALPSVPEPTTIERLGPPPLERLLLAALASALLVVSVLGGSRILDLSRQLESVRSHELTSSRRVSVILASGVLRSADSSDLPTVELNGSEALVELKLDLPFSSHETYRALVQDAYGATILTLARLSAQEYERRVLVVVPVPASSLPAGDYSVVLQGVDPGDRDEREVVGRYPLRIRTK